MFCFDFSDKVVALTANRKLGISKFYELLSEPQTNQPQFITRCSHCVYEYPLLLQTFKTCDCSHARCRAIGRVVKLLCTHVAFLLVWVSKFEYHQKQQHFAISFRISENKKLFFKKMYEIRMKQL